jgi:hypothetical protein
VHDPPQPFVVMGGRAFQKTLSLTLIRPSSLCLMPVCECMCVLGENVWDVYCTGKMLGRLDRMGYLSFPHLVRTHTTPPLVNAHTPYPL